MAVLRILMVTGRILSLGNKKGPIPEIQLWLLKASIARGVREFSAIPFGVLESGIQTVAFTKSTWSFPWV